MRWPARLTPPTRRTRPAWPVRPGWPAPAWPAGAGLAALALATVLAGVAAPRWRAEAETRLASLATAAPPRPAPEATRPGAAPAWPAAVQSPRRALALHGLARRSGLEVLLVREQVDAATHLQLVMHGTAAYPALRQFVERALAADPALVLDRLRLHRGETDAAQVNFELQWTLLHSPPAQASTGRIETAR